MVQVLPERSGRRNSLLQTCRRRPSTAVARGADIDDDDRMSARIGPNDQSLLEHPRPHMLQELSGISPVAKGTHVLLDEHGIRSIQRLALADIGGRIVLGLWPAELKPQAEYAYKLGRARRMIDKARELGWTALPGPHIAFHNASPPQRLYLYPALDAVEYARRWEGSDGVRIGQWANDTVHTGLWPWLKARGYADDTDDPVLEEFLGILNTRHAHLRPGLPLRRELEPAAARALGTAGDVGVALRLEVDAILRAGDELPLPASRFVSR